MSRSTRVLAARMASETGPGLPATPGSPLGAAMTQVRSVRDEALRPRTLPVPSSIRTSDQMAGIGCVVRIGH